MIIHNIGKKPEVIGRDSNGYPTAIQPGKSAIVSDEKAAKLLQKETLVDEAGFREMMKQPEIKAMTKKQTSKKTEK